VGSKGRAFVLEFEDDDAVVMSGCEDIKIRMDQNLAFERLYWTKNGFPAQAVSTSESLTFNRSQTS